MLTKEELKQLRTLKAKERAVRKARRKLALHQPTKADRGRVRDNGYLAYLRRQPCRIPTLVKPSVLTPCGGRIDPAHLRYTDPKVGRSNPGLSCKSDDRWATSLCRRHHEEQHAYGNERAWWAGYGLDGSQVAIEQYAAYRAPRGTADEGRAESPIRMSKEDQA